MVNEYIAKYIKNNIDNYISFIFLIIWRKFNNSTSSYLLKDLEDLIISLLNITNGNKDLRLYLSRNNKNNPNHYVYNYLNYKRSDEFYYLIIPLEIMDSGSLYTIKTILVHGLDIKKLTIEKHDIVINKTDLLKRNLNNELDNINILHPDYF